MRFPGLPQNMFSPTEILLGILLCAGFVIGVGNWSLHRSYYAFNTHNSRAVETLISDFSEKLGSVSGIVTSLSFIQQSLEIDTGDELSILAHRSVTESDIVLTIGRYQITESARLEKFTASLQETGLYQFEVIELDNRGVKKPLGERASYSPLIWQAPFSPEVAKYIGVDLFAIPHMAQAIADSNQHNSMTLVTVPAGWSTDADVVLISPTYRGRYTPTDPLERVAQSSGGFLIGLDFSPLIAQMDLLLPGSELEIALNAGYGNNKPLLNAVSNVEASEHLYLRALFAGLRVSSSPDIGRSSLLFSVQFPAGVTGEAIRRSIILMMATFALFMLAAQQVFRERSMGVRLQKERQKAHVTLKSIADAVVTTDEDGVITYINPSAEKLLGKDASSVKGCPIGEVIVLVHDRVGPDENREIFSIRNAMAARQSLNLPALRIQGADKSTMPVDSTLTTLGDSEEGNLRGFVLVMRDVSSERQLTRELEYQATHDSLTKIANRFVFEQKLEELIESSKDGSCKHAICYIDLDQFKAVNDTCGHAAGDDLLVRVTQGLLAQVREADTLARLGGDEFGLLITNCEEHESESIAKKIHCFFQDFYFQYHDNVFAVRASIGFVHLNGRFLSIKDVMSAADLACYSAKDRGRNELHIYNQADQETTARKSEMMLLPKLQKALQCDNFVLYVQPIVRLGQGTEAVAPAAHYEILLRLQDDNGKLITPLQMIAAAERYNLMRDVDRWVIAHALREIANMQGQFGSNIPTFSINLSGQSATDKELPDFIADQITANNILPRKLNFEITETSAITNMESAVQLVSRLHDLGCTLALDDFGSGMSSFGYLKILPVDYLKIDGQFIKNIHRNDVDLEMVRCTKAVADLLEIKTVAEFVENARIVAVLEQLEIDYAQGYHYSKPFLLSDVYQLIQQAKAA